MHSLLIVSRILVEGGIDGILAGLGVNLVQLLAQIVNFLLIMTILTVLVIRPTLRNLEARRKSIEESLENARLADERLANVEKECQARLNEAASEAKRVREDTLASAQQEATGIRNEARAERDLIRRQARIDAQAESSRLLANSRNDIVALVMAATSKLIGDSLDANRQKALIDDFFTKMPPASMAGVSVNGAPITITSALPLTPEEQTRVKNELSRQIGVINEITFEVDPSILGGLIIRVGDKVIDGSMSGKVNALRRRLRE